MKQKGDLVHEYLKPAGIEKAKLIRVEPHTLKNCFLLTFIKNMAKFHHLLYKYPKVTRILLRISKKDYPYSKRSLHAQGKRNHFYSMGQSD